MLTDYIQAALRHAHYEIMENGRFWGDIAPCKGCWGDGDTLEECRENLDLNAREYAESDQVA